MQIITCRGTGRLHLRLPRRRRLVLMLFSALVLCSLGACFEVCLLGAAWARQSAQQSSSRSAQTSYDKWLDEEVPYIITDLEKAEFKRLTTDKERQEFIERFWEIRNPDPGSRENLFRKEYYRRLAYAKQHYGYLAARPRDDRARIYIEFGAPDRIEQPGKGRQPAPSQGANRVVERWTYRHIDGIGDNITVDFVDPRGLGEHLVVVDPLSLVDHTPSGG
jgi:GWxTD domain-containing protein